MPVAAVIDKGRLQRGFDPCYLGQIDVAGKLPAVDGLEIELLDLVSVNHHHAGFLGVGGIDKQFLSHDISLRATAGPGGRQGLP